MELYCYSDHESQALHLGPLLTSGFMVSSGDLETQPLFLELVFLEVLPDACHLLDIGPDAITLLRVPPNAQFAIRLQPQAQASILYEDFGRINLTF